ncbi:MAG: SDR family NAD(P)-dependent oxidoreductase [Christensenellales bacterium]|jgi:3-oxoacyl-[acyl-carrier protein] reductase
MRFASKVAFVTGAGGYIGGTVSRMFAKEGASVAVCDINEETIDNTVRAVVESGGSAAGILADVTQSASIDAAVAKAVELFGRLDIMVHVAGGSARADAKPLVEQSDEVIERIIRVNMFGGIYASRAAGRQMIKQGAGGRIISISSVVAFNGVKGCVEYGASKGGLIAMSRGLAKELAPYKITVNTVAPGIVQRPGETNDAVNTNFLGVKCTAEDVGNVVLFMASDEAHFITGQTYIVDGGRGLAMKGTD